MTIKELETHCLNYWDSNRELFTRTIRSLRKLCHRSKCNKPPCTCPEECGCGKKLNEHTALVWDIADLLESLVCRFARTDRLNQAWFADNCAPLCRSATILEELVLIYVRHDNNIHELNIQDDCVKCRVATRHLVSLVKDIREKRMKKLLGAALYKKLQAYYF